MAKYVMRTAWQRGDAQAIGEELTTLASANEGRFTPHQVLEFARDEERELHKCFTWDDGQAAAAYRLGEARRLIRSIEVVVDQKRSEPFAVNVMVESEDKVEQYYSTPDRIRSNADEMASAKSLALGRMSSARRSLQEIEVIASNASHICSAKNSIRYLDRAADELNRINPQI